MSSQILKLVQWYDQQKTENSKYKKAKETAACCNN